MKHLFLLLFLPLLLFASEQKISLQLDWKHQFEFAGFYAAKSQGYYKDFGLDVDFVELKDGINISDEVLSGNVEFGISSSSLILEKFHNKDVVLLASYFKQNALSLITSSNITSLKDLKNKKIMATKNELSSTALSVMLQENGLKSSDYTRVKQEFSVDKFIAGEVDAMSVFITNQPYLLHKNGIKFNTFSPADFGIYSYDLELFSSHKYVTNHPELVRNFIEASQKGWKYAFNHKQEVVELIYTKYSNKKSQDALMYEADKIQELFKTETFKIGSIIPELVELNAVVYEKLGLVQNSLNIKKLLNDYIFEHKNSNPNTKHKIKFSHEELKFLAEHRTIKIANEMDWPPFDYNEFGKPKGLGINYVKLLLDKVDIKYKFVNGYTWAELVKLFKEKKVDILPAFYKNEVREKFTNFTVPYYQGELAIFALNSNSTIKSSDDLKSKIIGIEKSDASASIIKQHFKGFKIVEIVTNHKLIKELSLRHVDAIIGNPKLFQYHSLENGILNFHQIGTISLNEAEQKIISLHIGIRNDYKILFSIIQKVINSLNKEELKRLKNEWLDSSKNKLLQLNASEVEYLTNKKITMCIDPDWMPFEKLEKKKHIGMAADYLKLIEKKLNTNITLIRTSSWTESLQFVKERKCDILSLAMKTKTREEYLNFTTPYLSVPLVLATKLNVNFIANMRAIENKTVCIPKGYAFAEILHQKYPNLNIITVKNIHEGLEQVKKGKVFGYIGTLASVGYLFQTEYTGEFKIAGKFNDNWELGIGVRNDDLFLLNILQKTINSIDKSQMQIIMNKWLAIKYEKGTDYRLVWSVFGIALFILLLTLLWTKKISRLNDRLKIAKEKADEATRTKANFLSNMSHEIRTPMNSILGMSYLVKETNLNKIQADYIEKIEKASNNLLTLLNDILDFSKLEARKLEIKKTDFNLLEVLGNVENLLQVKSYEKDLEFKVSYEKKYSMYLHGDSMRLSQILINLLSNAIKFTDKGKVELIVEKIDNTLFRFTILDTGIGLTLTQQEKIFASFSQADSSITRKYGGTGLGLAISKELVQLMDGKIWVESNFGKGSKFIFEIEIEESKKSAPQNRTAPINSELSITENKLFLDEDGTKLLFDKLQESCKKRRPQLCEPILYELEKYQLSQSNTEILSSASILIKKYKFDDAWRILNEK